MLDDRDAEGVIDRLWSATSAQANLPEGGGAFFDTNGPMRAQFDSRRAFHRFYFRRRAILLYDGTSLGAYTKDVSRTGVAVLSPVQLFPRELAQIVLPGPRKLEIEARRCRRVGDGCFEIGGLFTSPNPDLEGLLDEVTPA